MYYVYILESERNKKHYIGQTQDLEARLDRHNAGRVTSTKPGKPWKLKYWKSFEKRSEAFKTEQLLKSFKKQDRVIRFAEENDFRGIAQSGPEKSLVAKRQLIFRGSSKNIQIKDLCFSGLAHRV